MSGCLALTRVPFSAHDPDHAAGLVGLDLVEQLHGLDQADHLAHDDLAADLHEGRRPGAGRGVEDPRERREDGGAGRSRGGCVGGGGAGRPGGSARRGEAGPRQPRRSPRRMPGADRPGRPAALRRTMPVPPASTSSSVRSLRSRSAARRSTSARSDASPPAVPRRLPRAGPRRRPGAGPRDRRGISAGRGAGSAAIRASRPAGACDRRSSGHASHRRKTRALFWPPKPNELLTATRIGRRGRRSGSGPARRPPRRGRPG